MSEEETMLKIKLLSEINDLREALDSMLIETVECIRPENMTNELKEAIAIGNERLHGPKSEYITQDPEFDKRSV